MVSATQDLLTYLRSPQAIRARCHRLLELADQDRLPHFRCHLERLPAVARYVLDVTRANYPTLDIPFHSRWRHFEVGGEPRLAELTAGMAAWEARDRARAQFDLAITSVLLDAGAGPQWQYQEAATGKTYRRSEGLAVASFRAFAAGLFSSQPDQPWRADAAGLQALTVDRLATAFQVSGTNPLVGLEGRVQLLRRLGQAVQGPSPLFPGERPGGLVDFLAARGQGGALSAVAVLEAVLTGFGDIWPGRLAIAGVNLGDVWFHSTLAQIPDCTDGYVPLHKLSQWLTYSLLEPLQNLGWAIADLDHLTGLAEYRNGGLCLDLGLLTLKDPEQAHPTHAPSSELIVEWRALTVALLDHVADSLRQTLGLTPAALPLVKILQGGTWAAGRRLAAERRPEGRPPLAIASDGTVF